MLQELAPGDNTSRIEEIYSVANGISRTAVLENGYHTWQHALKDLEKDDITLIANNSCRRAIAVMYYGATMVWLDSYRFSDV